MSWALTKGNLHLRWRQGGFTPHAYLGIKLLTVTEKAHENVIIIQVLSLKNNLGIMHSKNVWESRTADVNKTDFEGALRKGNKDVVNTRKS